MPAQSIVRSRATNRWLNDTGTLSHRRRRRRKKSPPLAKRVVVRTGGPLDLKSWELEREEARALVEFVTCAGSLNESAERQSGALRSQTETEQWSTANTDCSE
ncbi:hypothetical protein NDU88_002029 [Pleurodeles waltl]|uniref:Uncharacterized protein n=1 Tax=Pleurodeles waltl TaxID=8319 RepID=A0AAV7KR23_PLEWA|nr:hypothetical protein NDU88_002029 [Pleurodeles waltl]